MVCCPITSSVKGYPFEVALTGQRVQGVVLSDQIKSLDWVARKATCQERAPETIVQDVLAKAVALLS